MPLSYHARRLALVRLCMRPCVCVLVLGKSVRGKSLTFVTRSLFCSSYLILLGVQVTGARILQGQQRGETGEENYLSWCVVRVFVQLSVMVRCARVRAAIWHGALCACSCSYLAWWVERMFVLACHLDPPGSHPNTIVGPPLPRLTHRLLTLRRASWCYVLGVLQGTPIPVLGVFQNVQHRPASA